MSREFFATRTVAEALAGFNPTLRTPAQTVPLAQALGRVPACDVVAPAPLPGFARSTVDGYAVRAADTYGTSEGLPSYLDVIGAVRMGAQPDVTVAAGTAVEMPTGGVLPVGADAVVMVEYTTEAMPGTVEVLRPVAPGGGIVRADDDVTAGAVLVPAGRPLRAADLGMLAAAGIIELVVHARPRVAILSTGDEVVPPATVTLRPGQVRDAIASALAGLVLDAGGSPVPCGIVPDDPAALRGALQAALAQADLVVISAGSSVGARDATADAVATLGKPGIFCHGLAVKPGKPTLLAECDGVPVIGLPGNPLSALVVFRLVGTPLVWRLAGCATPPPEPSVTASLTREVPSEAGRRDVVQVRLGDGQAEPGGQAEPLFGASALLSVLTRADGYLVVPEAATGLDAGAHVSVTLYR
ncbi:MAG TPA: gephyrin-like molybdotransferase Glp [Pseudonocardiaceae bacterium]|nr:gephyrin-like molybdotransferase Glp [Pseudonocardiaceae bacterium]